MDRTRDDAGLPEGKDALEAGITSLKEQTRRLKAERDILRGHGRDGKEDPGADSKNLTNMEKTP